MISSQLIFWMAITKLEMIFAGKRQQIKQTVLCQKSGSD